MIRILFFSFLLFFTSLSFAQDDTGKVNILPAKDSVKTNIVDEFVFSSSPDTSEVCEVYLKKNNLLKDVNLLMKNDTTLFALKKSRLKPINISEIRKLVFKPPSPFWTGYMVGAGIGFLSGFIPVIIAGMNDDNSENVSIGVGLLFGLGVSIPSGLIGGVISMLTSADDVYFFDAGISPAKVKRIKYLIKKHQK